MNLRSVLLPAIGSLILLACGPTFITEGGPGGDAGTSCNQNADCPNNGECIFEIGQACAAHGTCFALFQDDASCPAAPVQSACGCDGTDVTWSTVGCTAIPAGYAPAPVASMGPCAPDANGPCTSDADCGSSGLCGFLESAACGATGQCFVNPGGAECGLFSPGCACDGTMVNLACNGLPGNYAPKPLAYEGQCTDLVDAGLPPASPCQTSADCPEDESCGFLQSAGCSATGQCFAVSGAICNAFSPGCACDGSTENIACNGLPNGYVPAPLSHPGLCVDASP